MGGHHSKIQPDVAADNMIAIQNEVITWMSNNKLKLELLRSGEFNLKIKHIGELKESILSDAAKDEYMRAQSELIIWFMPIVQYSSKFKKDELKEFGKLLKRFRKGLKDLKKSKYSV